MKISYPFAAMTVGAVLATGVGLPAQTSTKSTSGSMSAGATTGATATAPTGGAAKNDRTTAAAQPSPSTSANQSSATGAAQPNSGATNTSSGQAAPPTSGSGSITSTAPATGNPTSPSGSISGSATGTASGSSSTTGSTDTSQSATAQATQSASRSSPSQSTSVAGSSTTPSAGTTRNNLDSAATAVSDAQITTFVQGLDAQGPAIVHRVSTVVGDLACGSDTLTNLVEALHSGKSVTIASTVNGQRQTAAFDASGAHLGYGEAYLALALAAEELRHAGITGCATPDQWQAALLGGPLRTSITATTANTAASAGTSVSFPGIVTLHRQGQGWGQIAQSNNLQLGQIINASGTENLTPTGRSSAEMNQGHNQGTSTSAQAMPQTKTDNARGQDKDRDKDRDHDKDGDKDHDDVPRADSPTNTSPPDR